MKSIKLMFLSILITMIGFTSCSPEAEQTETGTKTVFNSKNLTAREETTCEKEEYCAQDAVNYYIEFNTNQLTSRCHVTSIRGNSNGTYSGYVYCSVTSNYYIFTYYPSSGRVDLFLMPREEGFH